MVKAFLTIIVGIALTVTAVSTDQGPEPQKPWKPCVYEDGPGPCVWDASHRGNGIGSSLIVTKDDDFITITHERAQHLLNPGG